MKAWSHLPNAAHIDAILADLRDRPLAWAKAWEPLRDIYCEMEQAAFMEAKSLVDAEMLEGVRDADRKSTRLNSSHIQKSRMPSSA